MNARTALATVCLLLLALAAQADDKSHAFTDLFGKERTETWWSTMAECAGRAKSLTSLTTVLKRGDPKEVEDRTTMFWIIAVSRVQRDRAVSEDEASKIVFERAQEGYQLQEQANLTYTAASKMDWEYDRRLADCERHLNAYAAAFPEDFKRQ